MTEQGVSIDLGPLEQLLYLSGLLLESKDLVNRLLKVLVGQCLSFRYCLVRFFGVVLLRLEDATVRHRGK